MNPYLVSLLSLTIVVFGAGFEPPIVYAQGFPPAAPGGGGAAPPPPPQAVELRVFYTVGGQTFGPLNTEQLKAKIATGEVGHQTLVWMDGMAEWQAAATVAAIAPLLPAEAAKVKFDAAAYLVGTWEQSQSVPLEGIGQGDLNASMTYRADGTATGYGTLTSQTYYGLISVTITSQGTWTVQAKTEDSFLLTPNMQVTTSGGTGVPTTSTNNTPVLVTVIDRNTVSIPGGIRSFRVGP